jgi:hypothetical protein
VSEVQILSPRPILFKYIASRLAAGRIASHPCKKRKDGPPGLVRTGVLWARESE